MKFRPCIDIHNGKVKQIVGGSLKDAGDAALENYVSEQDAAWYARLYRDMGLSGGHVILLNPSSSPYYAATLAQAKEALAAWPGGLQIGGGVTADNAADFLDAGASHVIVTSYVFRNGEIDAERLWNLIRAVGRSRLVLDLSCRKKDGRYYIVTDRWQTFTDVEITVPILEELSSCCAEFLIHAADAEGKQAGPDLELVRILGEFLGQGTVLCPTSGTKDRPLSQNPFKVTYAGGIGSFDDLRLLKDAGRGLLDVTVGSALDLFGGAMLFEEVLRTCRA